MALNSEKCLFAQSSVKFLGHVIDSQGIRPDRNKVSAIEPFSRPTNVSDVRWFLGMVNQLSKFSPNLADMTQPLRELLVKENAWGICHQISENTVTTYWCQMADYHLMTHYLVITPSPPHRTIAPSPFNDHLIVRVAQA